MSGLAAIVTGNAGGWSYAGWSETRSGHGLFDLGLFAGQVEFGFFEFELGGLGFSGSLGIFGLFGALVGRGFGFFGSLEFGLLEFGGFGLFGSLALLGPFVSGKDLLIFDKRGEVGAGQAKGLSNHFEFLNGTHECGEYEQECLNITTDFLLCSTLRHVNDKYLLV